MKIKDIDESFSGAIAGLAMPLGGGNKSASIYTKIKKSKKNAVKGEDAQIGGKISNTNKRYGPTKGPKFTAGAGMPNGNYPPKKKK